MKKAVSEIIAAVLIVTITIGLTSTAYIWGKPLIEKRQEATTTERVYNKLSQTNENSLSKTIEDVANNRGIKTFTIDADGIWTLDETNDYITFSFPSKTSNIAVTTTPISFTAGVQCVIDGGKIVPSPVNGTSGQDSPSVVCAKAVRQGDVFVITYTIIFREIYNNPFSQTASGFKIDLVKDPTGLTTSSGRTVKISYGDTTQEVIGGKTLIKRQVKILLI
ncbi:MAG: hypothetical protein HYW24_02645 [Candidatus Aenigmarchaeota archaeon]|nr:hypothetical protein [Candidatus Aenigmarchaeota archaeon]